MHGAPQRGTDARARARRLLDDAFDVVAARPLDASLFAGFPGVAWAAEHIAGLFGSAQDADGSGEADPNAPVDDALIEVLARSPWRADYDLVTGLAGLAVYAFERLPRPSARRCLELILDRLTEMAERKGG